MRLGTLTAGALATVESDGTIVAAGLRLGWRVRPAEAWLLPGIDAPVRQGRPFPAPLVETAMRVPGGDARAQTYAVDADGGVLVMEVVNDSPSAIAAAFVIDSDPNWVPSYSRPIGATESDGAVVFPVPHRTSVRVALASHAVDARGLPDPATVERGWDALLERGMRVEFPDGLQREVDAARADLFLASPSGAAFAALEAWGFDDEAAAMWPHLGWRERRAARRGAAGVLGTTHVAALHEGRNTLDVFPGFRSEWLGASLAVHDVPLRSGRASFALRWHGPRPALLWDVPEGLTVRTPTLDPAFSSAAAAGETLLAEPPAALLPMGGTAPVGGAPIEPPEEFS